MNNDSQKFFIKSKPTCIWSFIILPNNLRYAVNWESIGISGIVRYSWPGILRYASPLLPLTSAVEYDDRRVVVESLMNY
jgi:hypothetical protein